jgi:hypothetical protein
MLPEMFVETPQEIAREARARSIEKWFLHAEAISLWPPKILTTQFVPRPCCSLTGPLSADKYGEAFAFRYSAGTNGLS